jgi:hypothetical protein
LTTVQCVVCSLLFVGGMMTLLLGTQTTKYQ